MTLAQIQELNIKYQRHALKIVEIVPSSGFVQAVSLILRSTKKIEKNIIKLLQSRSVYSFNNILHILEEEADEITYIIDRIEDANKKQKISLIQDFVKEGHQLMTIYSKFFDFIIKKKIIRENE